MTGGTSNHFEQEVSLKRITGKVGKLSIASYLPDLISFVGSLSLAGVHRPQLRRERSTSLARVPCPQLLGGLAVTFSDAGSASLRIQGFR